MEIHLLNPVDVNVNSSDLSLPIDGVAIRASMAFAWPDMERGLYAPYFTQNLNLIENAGKKISVCVMPSALTPGKPGVSPWVFDTAHGNCLAFPYTNKSGAACRIPLPWGNNWTAIWSFFVISLASLLKERSIYSIKICGINSDTEEKTLPRGDLNTYLRLTSFGYSPQAVIDAFKTFSGLYAKNFGCLLVDQSVPLAFPLGVNPYTDNSPTQAIRNWASTTYGNDYIVQNNGCNAHWVYPFAKSVQAVWPITNDPAYHMNIGIPDTEQNIAYRWAKKLRDFNNNIQKLLWVEVYPGDLRNTKLVVPNVDVDTGKPPVWGNPGDSIWNLLRSLL